MKLMILRKQNSRSWLLGSACWHWLSLTQSEASRRDFLSAISFVLLYYLTMQREIGATESEKISYEGQFSSNQLTKKKYCQQLSKLILLPIFKLKFYQISDFSGTILSLKRWPYYLTNVLTASGWYAPTWLSQLYPGVVHVLSLMFAITFSCRALSSAFQGWRRDWMAMLTAVLAKLAFSLKVEALSPFSTIFPGKNFNPA